MDEEQGKSATMKVIDPGSPGATNALKKPDALTANK